MAAHELTLGVVGSSTKENEKRLPIHPDHLNRIPAALSDRIWFERDYGSNFAVPDSQFAAHSAGIKSRDELFATCDIILLPKPTDQDFASFRDGQILWGWPHCVQGTPITQLGIDKRLTYIAWEEMHHWNDDGTYTGHVFARNNEMAGYCSAVHALELSGRCGHYGRPEEVVVLGCGATGQGAIRALAGLGYTDLTVFNRYGHGRPHGLADQYHHLYSLIEDGRAMTVTEEGEHQPMIEVIARADIIVNAILQNPNEPYMFVTENEIGRLKRGALIVDVSCDLGMGFPFARPTSFEEPAFSVGDGVTYYAVDHSPSLMYRSASWEISESLLPFLTDVLAGPDAWHRNPTIKRSLEIIDGVIQNPAILRFQDRTEAYPHPVAS